MFVSSMVKTIRFGRESVENIKCRADDKTRLALYEIPDFLFVHDDILIVLRFQVVQFVDLALEDGESFAERLETCVRHAG